MLPWWRTAGERLRLAVANSRPFHTIQAIPREVTGSRVSARERAQGRIPAVVFTQQFTPAGPEGVATRSISRKHLLTIERKQIHSILKSIELDFFCSTAFKLQIRAGSGSSMLLESGNVLPIKIHRDEETGKIFNLVFVWADEGSKLAVDVPVVFKGKEICPGLNKDVKYLPVTPAEPTATNVDLEPLLKSVGSTVFEIHLSPENLVPWICCRSQSELMACMMDTEIRSSLKFLCPADQIPQKIEVDISNLDIGDRILLHDIKVDSSLKLLSKNSTKPVIKIVAMNVGNPGTLS